MFEAKVAEYKVIYLVMLTVYLRLRQANKSQVKVTLIFFKWNILFLIPESNNWSQELFKIL